MELVWSNVVKMNKGIEGLRIQGIFCNASFLTVQANSGESHFATDSERFRGANMHKQRRNREQRKTSIFRTKNAISQKRCTIDCPANCTKGGTHETH
ncbi:MAG: hypothetical protein CL524_11645 [Aequorivita sp.]|nr:hypothetical protein [Aequorivita sp.]